jgi:pimeloyl-ACP methyl ester carboxylesterase
MCDKLIAFLDAKQVNRATFIGGSMGGHIGLLMALNHPERVDKLVMMGSTGAWPPPGILLDLALKTLWNEHLVTDFLRARWPKLFSMMFKYQTEMTRRLFEYQMAVRADYGLFAPEGRAATRQIKSIFYTSCRGRLAQVKVPVLLVWGESDQIHPPRDSTRYLREHLPDSRLVVVRDSGHEVMIDQPAIFNRLILTFLASGTRDIVDQWPKQSSPAAPPHGGQYSGAENQAKARTRPNKTTTMNASPMASASSD